jgi:phage-related minor tail protein
MKVTNRLSDAADTLRERRLRMKAESLDDQNREMKTEVRALRDELDRERDARAQMLDAIRDIRPEKVKVKRRGGMLRLIVIGGTAYILGAKAGRERYEEIRRWWSEMRERMSQRSDESNPVGELSA